MQALDQLLRSHSATLRARGLAYHREGRVRIVQRSGNSVRAKVRGTRDYSVLVERARGAWNHACTCPAHEDRGQCKHVCAVASKLMAEAGNVGHAASTPARHAALHLIPDDDDEEDDEDEDEDEADDDDGSDDLDRGLARRLDPRLGPADLERLTRASLLSRGGRHRFPAPVESVESVESEPQRSRRLFQALEATFPTLAAPAPSLALRYVLAPVGHAHAEVELEIQAARVSPRGDVGAWRILDGPPRDFELDETDRVAVAVLMDAPHGQANSYSYEVRRARYALRHALQRLLLPGLARAARLHYTPAGPASLSPLALDDGASWDFGIGVDSADDRLELEGALERSGERIPLAEVACVLGGGFAIARGALLRVDWHGVHGWAAHLCGTGRLRLASGARLDVARLLARAPVHLPVRAEGLFIDLAGTPRPILTLLAPEGTLPQLQARLEFEYGGERLPRGGPSVFVHGERVLRVQRDRQAEARAEAQFAAAGGKLRAPLREPFDGTLERKRLGTLVRALADQGWLVEGAGLALRTQGKFALAVSSGIDWFDVQAEIEFEGVRMELPALLEALERRQPLVRLADGSFGVVPEAWLAQWQALGALGEVHQGALRVKSSRAFLLDTLLAEREGLTCDAGFTALRERLARARTPQPLREPATFAGLLRPYQRAGLGWLDFLHEVGMGGCLADDMGLGKTVQVLALIVRQKPKARGPALVVAPKTLLFNWQREAARFAPKLTVLVHHGSDRVRSAAALEDADLVVTTYATLRQDVELFRRVRFGLVVLDEAQAIKNATSQSAKAVRILEADQRLALTGTPIENRVEDLLSIFEFLNPGLLEGSRVLRKLLEGDDELETARLAARALGPFLLRRTKEEVLTDLPRKSEQVVACELEGTQRREYDALRVHYRRTLLSQVDTVGIERAGINVLEALLRLRQAACHLALIDDKHALTRSAKLDTLLSMLEELRDSGHKALVFSQFTSFLALVKPELDKRKLKYDYLDGKTRDREQRVESFQQDPATNVFLISLKAGGVGLNLTSADYVFLLDPWWNPAVERQAIDRTHRIGQTRPVTAYRLVAQGTVEEKVLALQDKKRALADALFEGAGSALRDLTRADLEAILS